jgi:SRSO17 transposase
MERYVTGLLTDLPHKTADTIAATVAGTSTERLQHLLTDAGWDATALDEARVKRLLALHPPSSGVLVFDDTGLPKKGPDPRTQVSMGGTVRLRIENERMHLFDTDTGKAIFY